jgi:hypothetical protein
VSHKKQELLTLREHLSSSLVFGWVRVAHLLFFCVVLLCVFTFLVPCCVVHYDLRGETVFVFCFQLIICRRVHVLFTLFVFAGA